MSNRSPFLMSSTEVSFLNNEFDQLGFRNDPSILKLLSLDETVLLSTVIQKYNKDLKRQERVLLITSRAIYNIKLSLFSSIFSVLKSSSKVRRKIELSKLSAVSVSTLSSEFVLHVASEYDYRYASQDNRDKIILTLHKAFYMNFIQSLLPFYFHNEFNLIAFTTTEYDKKQNISRIPTKVVAISEQDGLQAKLIEIRASTKSFGLSSHVFVKADAIPSPIKLEDFDIIKVLGRGTCGKVMLVEKRDTKKLYALKSIHKEEIINSEQTEHIKTERYVLEMSKSPFVAHLDYAFQTDEKLFFVMPFMHGGELFYHLRKLRRFDERRAKFYIAEIILGLEHIHDLGVVYRDIKPENILLDEDGHVCLTDFGASKRIQDGELAYSLIGTTDYFAPEIIEETGHGKPVDWWTLGILSFEIMIGVPPFYNREQDIDKIYSDIVNKEVSFGTKIPISAEAKDFVRKILSKDPNNRLGSNGAGEIKAHPWFSDVNWEMLAQKKVKPPFKPEIHDKYDVNNFDEEFTNEIPKTSVIKKPNKKLLNQHQKEFENFGFMPSQKV